jgi:glycerate kinase
MVASAFIGLRECRTMALDDRPVLVAPDSFKGTLSAHQVAAAVGRGLRRGGMAVDLAPVADGGEGTMQVLLDRLGGEIVSARASDPLGREVTASFALLGDGLTALVEVAAASGLALLAPAERDAEAASSAGTGELIVAAVACGAVSVLVAAGGSASTDGGRGALEAIAAAGGLGGARLSVLCDVRTPFEQAAAMFGPQKGADAGAVSRLQRRLEAFGLPRGVAMTGAAGGLAGGLWANLDARLLPGASFVLDALDFDERMLASRAVIVGEGRLDATSLEGKIVAEVATRARQHGVPAHAIVGSSALSRFDARILDLQEILEATDEQALEDAGAALAGVIAARPLRSHQ